MKNKILESVSELYLKYGVRSVSMDDVAHNMAISKKTIYQYFDDKNDLVNQVTSMLLSLRQLDYDEISASASNALEELFSMSRCMRTHFSELNPSLMYDLQKYHKEAWGLFLKHEEEVVYHSVVDNLQRGIKEGFFRQEIDVNVLARLRVVEIHLSFDETVFAKDQFDFTEVQMQMYDHFVHGLLTDAGHELYKKYQTEDEKSYVSN